MRILVFDIGYSPYIAYFKDSQEAIRQVIRGDSEMLLPFGNDVIALVQNKEQNKRYNRSIDENIVICGRFFICGYNGEKICGLTHEQADRYYKRFIYPEVFVETETALMAIPHDPKIMPKDERLGKKPWLRER